jgi:hypothetical protein
MEEENEQNASISNNTAEPKSKLEELNKILPDFKLAVGFYEKEFLSKEQKEIIDTLDRVSHKTRGYPDKARKEQFLKVLDCCINLKEVDIGISLDVGGVIVVIFWMQAFIDCIKRVVHTEGSGWNSACIYIKGFLDSIAYVQGIFNRIVHSSEYGYLFSNGNEVTISSQKYHDLHEKLENQVAESIEEFANKAKESYEENWKKATKYTELWLFAILLIKASLFLFLINQVIFAILTFLLSLAIFTSKMLYVKEKTRLKTIWRNIPMHICLILLFSLTVRTLGKLYDIQNLDKPKQATETNVKGSKNTSKNIQTLKDVNSNSLYDYENFFTIFLHSFIYILPFLIASIIHVGIYSRKAKFEKQVYITFTHVAKMLRMFMVYEEKSYLSEGAKENLFKVAFEVLSKNPYDAIAPSSRKIKDLKEMLDITKTLNFNLTKNIAS